MNVDSLGQTTGHWINVFPRSGSYFTTISQKVTYIPKLLKESIFYVLVSPWWAYSQVTEDLKEKKNRLRNKYWLWLNGFKHKHRIVIKIRPHESNDLQLRFMEFMRTPPPSIIIVDSFITCIASRSRFFFCILVYPGLLQNTTFAFCVLPLHFIQVVYESILRNITL